MIDPSTRSAQAISASRRSADIVTPVGNWCAGVTITSRTSSRSSRSTRESALVHRDADHLQPGPTRGVAQTRPRGVLDGDPTVPEAAEHPRQPADGVGRPGAQAQLGRVLLHLSGPEQV